MAAIVLGAAAIAAVVLELVGKNEKTGLLARLLATASAVLGIFVAFC